MNKIPLPVVELGLFRKVRETNYCVKRDIEINVHMELSLYEYICYADALLKVNSEPIVG